MLSSDTFAPVPYDKDMMINDRLVATGEGAHDPLHKLAKEWSLSDDELKDGNGGWELKVEEISILATLLACGSGRKGEEPKVDFFLVSALYFSSMQFLQLTVQMHLLTSSIFLPAYMTPLSIPHRRTILRTYLLVLLLTALARGRPGIDFDYLMSGRLYPVAPDTEPRHWNSKDVISDPTKSEGRNPWLSLVESSLYHHGMSLLSNRYNKSRH